MQAWIGKGKSGLKKPKGRTTGPAFSHLRTLRTGCSSNEMKIPETPSPASHQYWGQRGQVRTFKRARRKSKRPHTKGTKDTKGKEFNRRVRRKQDSSLPSLASVKISLCPLCPLCEAVF